MFPAKYSFFAAEFSAGDVIDYFASFLAFLSTALLGLLALYQNNKLSNANVELSKINNDLVKTQLKPLITVIAYISEDKTEKNLKTFYRKVEKNNNKLLINYGYSTQPTYAPYQGFSIINIGMGAAVKVELYWYQLDSIEGMNDLNKLVDKEIENFYDKIKYSNFHYEEKEVLKNDDWLISPEVDLGVAEETNKFNVLLSYEVNVDPLHSIVEIRYEDLMQQKYKKLLYVGYIYSVPIMLPISKEYKIE